VNAHTVEDNDIIILGSDGLWDNLHRPKIRDLVAPFLKQGQPRIDKVVGKLAEQIALEAEQKSYLQRYMSPFAENARAHNYLYQGGKPDDITVIVAQV
jgi:protein phosphatase PTC7